MIVYKLKIRKKRKILPRQNVCSKTGKGIKTEGNDKERTVPIWCGVIKTESPR